MSTNIHDRKKVVQGSSIVVDMSTTHAQSKLFTKIQGINYNRLRFAIIVDVTRSLGNLGMCIAELCVQFISIHMIIFMVLESQSCSDCYESAMPVIAMTYIGAFECLIQTTVRKQEEPYKWISIYIIPFTNR